MWGGVVLVARAVLVVVFVVAAVAKLRDRPGTREAALALGLPARLAGPIALALPVGELAVAVLLAFSTTAPVGAVVAALLLAIFTVAIALTLRRGERPACNCFGQLSAQPIGRGTLLRNVTLLALAAFVATAGLLDAGPGVEDAGELSGMEAWAVGTAVALAAAVTLAIRFALATLRQQGRMLARIETLEAALAVSGRGVMPPDDDADGALLSPGDQVPAFALDTATGGTATLEELLYPAGRLLLVFTDPSCGPCRALAPQLAAWSSDEASWLRVASIAPSREEGDDGAGVLTLLDPDARVSERFDVRGTPTAFLVDSDGVLDQPAAEGPDEITALIEGAAERRRAGERARAALPLGGGDTLLVFWSASCGFCDAMLDDLLGWERQTERCALAVVAASDADAVRAQGFTSPVVADHGGHLRRSFGIDGTPMAVRVGPDGRERGEVAVGADEVLALAASPSARPELQNMPERV